jgi:DNA-binding FrmR family transcriptional regulator
MSSKEEHQRALITRLKRVEGQIRGIQGMIEKGAECEAIAQQLAAARKALDRSFYEMIACSVMQEVDSSKDLAGARRAGARTASLLAKYG